MKTLGSVITLLFLLVFSVNAQHTGNQLPDRNNTGNIEATGINQLQPDPLRKTSSWKHLTINSDSTILLLLEIKKEENIRKGGIDGFRVQIFQGPKDGADRIYSRFLALYPDYKIYKTFPGPDFKVRVGDFRERSEAIYVKYLIEKEFPNAMIVEDVINFPELKKENRNEEDL